MDGESLFLDVAAGRMAGGTAHAFRRCEQRPDHQPKRCDRGTGRPRNSGRADRYRAVLCEQLRCSDQGAAEGSLKQWTQFFIARKVVSIINLGSIAAIEDMVGQPVHPLRFRANLYVSGWPAWHESELLDRTLGIGPVRLKVVKRIVRCAATNVDPETAARGLTIPHTLMRHLGHNECGIYAEVIAGGSIAVDDAIVSVEPQQV